MLVQEIFDRHARDYDLARRRLVYCFDLFYAAILDHLDFERDAKLRIADLGAGTGLLTLFIAEAFPNAEIQLIDVSAEMLTLARKRLGDSDRFEYIEADYAKADLGKYDAIVSALSIHHLDAEQKQALFSKAKNSLTKGGVFINGDQIAGETPEQNDEIYTRWRTLAREAGATDADFAAAADRMREDKPSSVRDQLAWLEKSGFASAESVFEDSMFAVMVARVAAQSAIVL